MHKNLKSAVAAFLFAMTVVAALPDEVSAGPVGIANSMGVGLTAPVENVYYRRHYRRYYRGYGYDPAGAAFAGAAVGLMGAGIVAATRPRYYYYGYPGYYGYPAYPGWGW